MKWLVEKKIFGFGVALATLTVVGLISYWSTTKFIDTTYWLVRTNKIIIELEDVLLQMEKTQNGELDYIVTGKEPYLEPCYAAIEKIDQEIKDLQQLTKDNPNQQRRLDVLKPLIGEQSVFLNKLIDMRRNKGFEVTLQVVLQDKEKSGMANIQKLINEMENEENELLKQRSEETEASIRNTIIIMLIGSSVSFVLLLLIFYLLNREIAERKQAEEALRKRTERVIGHQMVLLELAKMDNSDLDSALKRITEVDSKTLGVERVSVWLFNEDRSEIIYKDLYKMRENSHEKEGLRLQIKDYPRYFRALEEGRILAVSDASTDPRTSEFKEGYLKPYGITSMMDVPIRLHGRVVGIVCHEHAGPKREWTVEEQDFAASIADMVSLALEASERKRAEQALEERLRFETLLSDLSTTFINLPASEVGKEIEQGLRRLVEFLGVDRSTILEFSEDKTKLHATYLYAIPGIQAVHNIVVSEQFPWYTEKLRRGEIIMFSRLPDDLPDEARLEKQYCLKEGFKSNLTIPLKVSGSILGAIAFGSFRSERTWPGDLLQRLRLVGEVFANALERKRAEEALRKAYEELEARVAERTKELAQANIQLKELDRLKSQFLATMSHELRTPLNSIIGFTGIILQGIAGDINKEQRKQLSMVYGSAKHLLSLINDILDLSRIESGKMEVSMQRFKIEDVVSEVTQSLSPMISQKGLQLITGMSDKPPEIYSDKKKVFQILLNLVNNAVKFTERGEIRIACKTDNDNLEVSVSDTGIGIKKENMGLLFEAFRQVDSTSQRRYEGTGLGLYLCQRLVTLLGGGIWAESEYGKGSRFTFTLPLGRNEGETG